MKNYRLAAGFLALSLLAACAVGYQARGTLSDVPGELRGKGYPGNSGGGRFVVSGTPEKVVNLMCFIAEEVREILAQIGFRRLEEIIVDSTRERTIFTGRLV